MAVRVVTDSASSITDAECRRLAITTVPMHVTADGEPVSETRLRDPEFYARLAEMSVLPGTSQPTPEEFAEVFRRIFDDGDDALAVLISAGMSGTVDSAELAAREVLAERTDARIEVLDSRSNSLEEGYAVLSAAEAARSGASLAECRRAAEETMRRTRFLFTPESLEYLRRGGRISRASSLLDVVLKIAPVLTADRGTTGVAAVARSAHSARAKIASLMKADVQKYGLKRAAVQFIANEAAAIRFSTEFIEPIVGAAVAVVPIHSVVGLHVGPAVGVVYETVEPLR
jgi:DegV family protein with EDD domain